MQQFQQIAKRSIRKVTRFFLVLCFFSILCVPRLLSLDTHWSSDEARWLRRSANFMSAVSQSRFSETLNAYHPGVMTMWISGVRVFFTEPDVNLINLVQARWLIGIVVWIGIGIACLLVYRLFGRWVAFTSFVCLAYSPLFLAQTRRIHTDALATVFILLTVLLFLSFCQQRQHQSLLVFSGIAFGLAVLSKSYALILLLWVPLCLFLFWNREKRIGQFLIHFAEVLCFLSCAVLTSFVLWPIFWTPLLVLMALGLLGVTITLLRGTFNERPPIVNIIAAGIGLGLLCFSMTQTVWRVFERVNWAITTPHEVEHFFLGKIVNDPGWLFYLFVFTINSTPLMLPLTLVGVSQLWKKRKNSESNAHHLLMALAFFAVVFLFTVCLSITSKKFSRYLLPTFPIIEILSAIGFVEGLKWIFTALRSRFGTAETERYKVTLTVIVCIGFFVIQIMPVLTLHPYYGTYYNLCWRGTDITKIITIGDASGLDIAAKYLNNKSDAEKLVVQVSPLATEIVQRYFRGHVFRANREVKVIPDYEIVYIRDAQVERVPQTGTFNGKLEHVITLNGIDYVWIYRVKPKEN